MSTSGDQGGFGGEPSRAEERKEFIALSLREGAEVLALVLNQPGRLLRMDEAALGKRLSNVVMARAWLMNSDPPQARAKYTAFCHIIEAGIALAREVRKASQASDAGPDRPERLRSKPLPPSVLSSLLAAVEPLAEIDANSPGPTGDPFRMLGKLLFALRGMGYETAALTRWIEQWLETQGRGAPDKG